jgi:hypothetical protein
LNRTTALLLALGLLVAHALTIQQDPSGSLGTIADRAYAALRLGRNWVHAGAPAWNPGTGVFDAYPSWGWVVLIALAERLYWPSLWLVQTLGTLGAIGTVIVVSRFSPARLTGVIGPLLLVVSGTAAAAALNGTEWSLFTLAATLALWSVEHRHPRWFAFAILSAGFLRPDALILWVALSVISRCRPSAERRMPWGAIAGAGLGLVVLLGLRALTFGDAWPPALREAMRFDLERSSVGVEYAATFFTRSGAPILAVIPALWLLGRPRSAGRTARCLALSATWIAWVSWCGGDELPFWGALLPALPPLVIAIQDSLTAMVYSRSRFSRAVGWVLFVSGFVASATASKLRADLGPFPLASIQDRWLGEPGARLSDDLDVGVTRLGQLESLVKSDRLRCLGLFVRDTLPAEATVLTPWPGTIGYLSRKQVIDLGERTEAWEGQRTEPWFGSTAGDLVRALERRPDFIIPGLQIESAPTSVDSVLEDWVEHFDTEPDTPERRARLAELFGEYVPIGVPIPVDSEQPQIDAPEPFVLLRRRDFGKLPRLSLELDGERFVVDVRHAGHRLVASLVVEMVDTEGVIWSLRPTGVFDRETGIQARSRLMVYSSGPRKIRLLEARLPRNLEVAELRARLDLPRPLDHTVEHEAVDADWGASLTFD